MGRDCCEQSANLIPDVNVNSNSNSNNSCNSGNRNGGESRGGVGPCHCGTVNLNAVKASLVSSGGCPEVLILFECAKCHKAVYCTYKGNEQSWGASGGNVEGSKTCTRSYSQVQNLYEGIRASPGWAQQFYEQL